MADPISLANLALSITAKTTEALNALRERAQRSKDIEIKDQINTLYDDVLQLKEVISRMLDEHQQLRRQLEEQQHPPEEPKRRQVGETIYYYKGDEGPFCQPCYDAKHSLVALQPQQHTQRGSVKRSCLVCHHTFYEQKINTSSPTPHVGRWS
jgi:regulator of replication initiation timing